MVESTVKILKNNRIAEQIYELTFFDDHLPDMHCGQFVNIEVPHQDSLILKRPLGIAKWDKSKHSATVCYQVIGKGTLALANAKEGDLLQVTYPLGNGFTIDGGHKKIFLVGGGVGIFPLLSVTQEYSDKKIDAFLGFRTAVSACYMQEFERGCCHCYVATEDGSLGAKGYITEHLPIHLEKYRPDLVLACGPMPMLKALKKVMSLFLDIPCQVSVEERMGCGVGACLVCACKIKKSNQIHTLRVCADGPVFDLHEVFYE